MIWCSSDWHLNHTNICNATISTWKSGFRNFASLAEMNLTIIENMNRFIEPGDTLYFLGDFAFGDKSLIPALRQQIRCKHFVLIQGNHDKVLVNRYSDEFSKVASYLEIYYNHSLFCLSHYPIGSWNEMARGAFQLHGHCHGNYELSQPRQVDVGVDCWEFKPLSIDFIIDNFSATPSRVDHHGDTNLRTTIHK